MFSAQWDLTFGLGLLDGQCSHKMDMNPHKVTYSDQVLNRNKQSPIGPNIPKYQWNVRLLEVVFRQGQTIFCNNHIKFSISLAPNMKYMNIIKVSLKFKKERKKRTWRYFNFEDWTWAKISPNPRTTISSFFLVYQYTITIAHTTNIQPHLTEIITANRREEHPLLGEKTRTPHLIVLCKFRLGQLSYHHIGYVTTQPS